MLSKISLKRPKFDPLKIVPRTVPSRLIRSSRSVPSTHHSRIRTVDEREFIAQINLKSDWSV